MRRTIDVILACVAVAACSSPSPPPPPDTYTRDQLLDPQTCRTCHPDHYAEWSESMHAYASTDPVFLAMNQRGQRETGGQLGSFCVGCHAPMAVREGATTDGSNLASVPDQLKGVTCYFCHDVDAVMGTHDDPLHLATGNGAVTMRGEYSDAIVNKAHLTSYSALHDRDQAGSATLCGSCHDIVTSHGAAIERTFAEWQASVFSTSGGDTCSQCHMNESTTLMPIALDDNAPLRHTHSHAFPAVDTAITTSFPGQADLTQQLQSFLDTTLQTALCVVDADPSGAIRVLLDNVAAGHGWPSGASQDRRVWVEIVAYQDDTVIYQSGVVPSGQSPVTAPDPDMWLLRDCMFDQSGAQVSMFWDAASDETNQLPAPVTFDKTDPSFYKTHVVGSFPADTTKFIAKPDRVTMKIHVSPIGLDVLDDLIASGDLDPAYRDALPIFDLDLGAGATLEWTAATVNGSYFDNGFRVDCVTASNFNVASDKVPAPRRADCSP